MRPIYQANEVARRAAERQLMRSIRSLTRSVPSRVDLAIEVRGFDPEDEQHLLALAKKEMSSRGYRLIRVESETARHLTGRLQWLEGNEPAVATFERIDEQPSIG